MFQKDTYCSYCGYAFAPHQAWPRLCTQCGNMTFQNPTPVAIILLPVDDGLLTVRRGIEPQKGKLALPGGYIDMGESWESAAARELYEEAGIRVEPASLTLFSVITVPRNVLIFGTGPALATADLPPFQPNVEASARVILTQPVELAFAAHSQAVRQFFA